MKLARSVHSIRTLLTDWLYLRRTSLICSIGLVLIILLAKTGDRALAQGNPTPLSPSEAYKAAMAPFTAAKAQPDDLTDADKIALGIGVAQASRDCLRLSADTNAFASDPKELLALSELCIFGQQYEPARATLVRYLALPQPPDKKLALVLLTRALLGLGEPDGAELQVESLLKEYPYDAQIHFAIDQVLDALEGLEGNSRNPIRAWQLSHLCNAQNIVTLPLIAGGKGLEGKDISASPSVLFADAVRCVAITDALRQGPAQDTFRQLTAIAEQPNWVGTADLEPMQAALQRQTMVGRRAPLAELHGHLLSHGALVPHAVPLMHGTVVLLPFALWAPSFPDVASYLGRLAPQQPIYAITSWGANTGLDDVPSKQMLMALRLWQETLPAHVSILIVPDAELSAFHDDSFPSGVVIRDGVVRSNFVLSSRGAQRMLLRALTDPSVRP